MERFPDDIIGFDRGRLRPPGEADLGDIRDACNDVDIRAWLPLPVPYTLEDARQFVEYTAAQLESGRGIERAVESQGRLSGMIGLMETNWKVGTTVAGYWLAPWGRGRGLMTSALSVMTQWAFDQGLHRVEVRIAQTNLPSLGVALRSGFRIEGVSRASQRIGDALVDMVILSRLASDPVQVL